MTAPVAALKEIAQVIFNKITLNQWGEIYLTNKVLNNYYFLT